MAVPEGSSEQIERKFSWLEQDEQIHRLTGQMVSIDLDDDVKHNDARFQGVPAKSRQRRQ